MADLDDFFAKKDRKKSKTSKRFATADECAKKLEETATKTEKLKKEKAPAAAAAEGEESTTPPVEQDEWKDFEEEKKDYSGLKIGQLTINAQEEGSAGEQNSDPNATNEEGGSEADRKSGPWRRVESDQQQQQQQPDEQQQQQQQQQQPRVERKPEPEPARTVGKSYVPPSMRGHQPSSQAMPMHASRMKSKAAPDIHNEEFFPTLAKGGEFKKNRNEGGGGGGGGSFEVVQPNKTSNYRQTEQSKLNASQGPELSNRFNSLSNDS